MSQNGDSPADHVDVLIVGAGISGVGAACRLTEHCPSKSFAILESRDAMGGTWDLFRYPGIRSDSDMFTLGYSFRPWQQAKAIADGPAIRSYIRETAAEYGIESKVRYGHRVVGAEWSTERARWTVEIERPDGETTQWSCGFIYACTGYYSYDEPFSPSFEGADRFRGEIIHPQHWPDDLDYTGKRVVVIGSGATAVTLVPSMADRAEHVTMLQRSPGYIVSMPSTDPMAVALKRILPARILWPLMRWKGALMTQLSYHVSQRWPRLMKTFVRKGVERNLPADYAIDPHFRPRYEPWDQRICLVPDGDLFRALKKGTASIATDEIETFTETGIRLASGEEIEADVIVTATGLNLLLLGGMELSVDGEEVVHSERVAYKGAMLSGVPNMVMALGYTNASWTLKCDLVSEYVCRLLNHMDDNGYERVTPREPDPTLEREPILDLKSGYVMRSINKLPKQGVRKPWRLYQNYPRDIGMFRRDPIEDGEIEFSRGEVRRPEAEPELVG